ncbi:MAG: hypothetical protein H8E54_00105 [Candidatus Aminicenantes bacterium]|nr:hypothetical protein [Candidatus Aminicenantes bacterium]
MYSFQALQILIFLIPGFISAVILDTLVVRMKKKELGKIIEALIFSMIIYTIYSSISGKSPISLSKIEESTTLVYDSKSFLWLALLSLFIPLVLSFLITNDLHMKLARKLRITRKTARASVWFDVFSDLDKHIIINFENDRRIYGWPMYYSTKPENPYIFLFRPAWIQEGKFVDLNIEGILITPEQKIESIEFLEE